MSSVSFPPPLPGHLRPKKEGPAQDGEVSHLKETQKESSKKNLSSHTKEKRTLEKRLLSQYHSLSGINYYCSFFLDLCLGKILYAFTKVTFVYWPYQSSYHWSYHWLNNLLGVFIATKILQIISGLFFGQTLGDIFLGLKGVSSRQHTRLRAAALHGLELLSLPLSLPAQILLRKRYIQFFSQKFLHYRVVQSVPGGTLFLIIVWSLVLGFMALCTPFFEINFSHLKLSDQLEAKTYALKSSDYASFQEYQSHKIGFTTFANPEMDGFSFIPNLKIIAAGDNKKYYPLMGVYDFQNKVFGEMSHGQILKWNDLLRKVKELSPQFSYRFKNLSQAMNLAKNRPKKLLQESRPLNQGELKELKQLVRESLSINRSNFFSTLAHLGPFLMGHIQVRNAMGSLMSDTQNSQVEMLRLNREDFLAIKTSVDYFGVEKGILLKLIPLNRWKAPLIELRWYGENENLLWESLQRFLYSFFSQLSWEESRLSRLNQLSSNEQSPFQVFKIYDHIFRPTPSLEKDILNYFSRTLQLAREKQDEHFLARVLMAIDRIYVSVKQSQKYSSSFRESLEELGKKRSL